MTTHDPTLIKFIDTSTIVNKFEKVRSKIKESKVNKPHMRWMESHENDSIIRSPVKGFKDGIPTIDQVFNDYVSGISCVAGRANAGKSTYIVSCISGILELNNDTIVLDFSFDDPPRKRYQQLVANLSGLKFIDIAQAGLLQGVKKEMYEEADNKLFNWFKEGRLVSLEHQEMLPSGQRLSVRDFTTVIHAIVKWRKAYPNIKIVAFVDAWNNLDTGSIRGLSELQTHNEMLKRLQNCAEDNEVKLCLSAHFRKTQEKRPSIQDIKGTSDMEFNAVSVLIARNEYKENFLTDPLMWEDENGNEFPILVLENHKTKVSEWEYPLFMILKSASCQLIPINPFEYTTYLEAWRGRKTK